MIARFVRRDARIYQASHCGYCGISYGTKSPHGCPPSTCLACGSTQCLYNGMGHGSCSICIVGMLPGWSGIPGKCGYKGCTNDAAAFAKRVGRACTAHFDKAGVTVYITKQMAERSRAWVAVMVPWPIPSYGYVEPWRGLPK